MWLAHSNASYIGRKITAQPSCRTASWFEHEAFNRRAHLFSSVHSSGLGSRNNSSSESFSSNAFPFHKTSRTGWNRTIYLVVMSHASYQCSTVLMPVMRFELTATSYLGSRRPNGTGIFSPRQREHRPKVALRLHRADRPIYSLAREPSEPAQCERITLRDHLAGCRERHREASFG